MTAQVLALSMKNLSVAVLTLIALGDLALVILIGSIAAYFLACAISKGTGMKGIMTMGVSLNEWPDNVSKPDDVSEEDTLLKGATLQITMEDPRDPSQEEMHYLFSPARSGLEQARIRHYPMEVFLHRYRLAFQNVCGREEPFCILLENLEKNGAFCAALGRIYRINAKQGVRILDNGSFCKVKGNPDSITICAPIPQVVGEKFSATTGCTAKNICFTMSYRDIPAAE